MEKVYNPSVWQSIKNFLKANPKRTVFVAAGIFILISLIIYSNHRSNEQEWSCLQRTQYRGSYYFLSGVGSNSRFKTQNEALNYCLTQLKHGN